MDKGTMRFGLIQEKKKKRWRVKGGFRSLETNKFDKGYIK